MALLLNSVRQYSSDLYEVARGVLRSRNRQAQRAERLAQQVDELRLEKEQLELRLQTTEKELHQTRQLVRHEQRENQLLRQRPLTLPSDLPLPHHTFGPKMIALCLNLSNCLGFRSTETALQLIFQWLGITCRIPSHDVIRCWSLRVGIAQLQRPVEAADDWIWMADHSNQIGTEKVLQILGIRAADLPEPGQTLPLKAMHVLAVVPGENWKREDVRREYKKLAKRIGAPRYLLTDGAVELRESADVLEKPEQKLTLLRDLKHVAANIFENQMGKSDRFAEFLSKLGRTRSAIQQTELSHFTPPAQKPKARFMNLGPTLRWGLMVSYHLSHSQSVSRRGISGQRMNDKLGWVRQFRKELDDWNRCQQVIQASLKFINTQGVYPGAAAELEKLLTAQIREHSQPCELSTAMRDKLIEFVKFSETELELGTRAWLSTENLESAFGSFKRLEGQHSKGGFTSLIAAMPTLLTQWTPELVRESLQATSVKQMKQWLKDNLPTTLTAKRATAYRELAAAPSG
jgi:hypothetical protein